MGLLLRSARPPSCSKSWSSSSPTSPTGRRDMARSASSSSRPLTRWPDTKPDIQPDYFYQPDFNPDFSTSDCFHTIGTLNLTKKGLISLLSVSLSDRCYVFFLSKLSTHFQALSLT